MDFFTYLTVYKSPFIKERIGRENDGGYIVCCIPNIKYDFFISGGICDDISFEEEFCKKYKDLVCYAYDGTIPKLSEHLHISHVQKNIGERETPECTNLHIILSSYSTIFVKMDIEGGEWSWIHSLSESHLQSIAQLCIEFHGPLLPAYIDIFEKLSKTHTLLHIHANNSNPCEEYETSHLEAFHPITKIPFVFECTYVSNIYLKDTILEKNTDPVPSPMDQPNLKKYPDIELNYPPFVWPKQVKL